MTHLKQTKGIAIFKKKNKKQEDRVMLSARDRASPQYVITCYFLPRLSTTLSSARCPFATISSFPLQNSCHMSAQFPA